MDTNVLNDGMLVEERHLFCNLVELLKLILFVGVNLLGTDSLIAHPKVKCTVELSGSIFTAFSNSSSAFGNRPISCKN